MLGGATQEGVAERAVLGGGVRRRLVVAQPLAEALVVEEQLLVLPREPLDLVEERRRRRPAAPRPGALAVAAPLGELLEAAAALVESSRTVCAREASGAA